MAPEITCKSCKHLKQHQAFGLCKACYFQQWKEKHKEQQSEYQKQYRRNHPKDVEYQRKKNAESYQRNRAKVLQRSKDRYWANPEAKLSKAREWDKTHRKNKYQYHKRWFNRKRTNGNGPGLTLLEWETILATYSHKCAYCGSTNRITQDHVQPLSRGGTDSPDNVVPACKSCNSKKGDKTPVEWGKWPIQS